MNSAAVDSNMFLVWSSFALCKIKIFNWLSRLNKINTQVQLQRKDIDITETQCVLRKYNAETSTAHLFHECKYTEIG